MSIYRKSFDLVRECLYGFLAVSILFSCGFQKQLPLSQHFEIIKIEKGIYAAIHKVGGKAICNVGIVDLGEKTLLFDSFLSPKVTQELLNALESMRLPEVKYVVNSHYHNDHIRGNQVFGEDVQIISSQKTKELIRSTEPNNLTTERKTGPAQLARYDSLYLNFAGDTTSVEYLDINMWRPYYQVLVEENATITPTLPGKTISTAMTIEGSAFDVLLVPTRNGHSQGDLYLHIPERDIVFAGDLMFKNTHPFLGAGDLMAWDKTLYDIKALNPQQILPGHGPMATKEDVDHLLKYMQDIQKLVSQEITEGQAAMPIEYRTWLLAEFYSLNIQLLTRKHQMQSK